MKKLSVLLVLLSLFAGAAIASADTLYESPQLTRDTALREKLLYDYMIDNSSDGLVFWWRNIVQRDGTSIRIYFQSKHVAPGYSVCFR